MDGTTILLFVAGLALLVLGANWLVKGAARLAAAAGVSALVIGLTVVAFGTSASELAVSVRSAWSGESDMAVGNGVTLAIVAVRVLTRRPRAPAD